MLKTIFFLFLGSFFSNTHAQDLQKEDSLNPTNIFCLAQNYLNTGDYELAIENYEKRALLGGNSEEVFTSLYLAGKLKEISKRPFELFSTRSSFI